MSDDQDTPFSRGLESQVGWLTRERDEARAALETERAFSRDCQSVASEMEERAHKAEARVRELEAALGRIAKNCVGDHEYDGPAKAMWAGSTARAALGESKP